MTGEAGENETPENELSLEQQLEQVEEAAEAVSEAIEAGDTERAQSILEQLETWRQNLSLTLSAAKAPAQNPELAEALAEIKSLRSELDGLKAEPKPPAPPAPLDPSLPQAPQTLEPETTPTPPMDGSPMERPASGVQEEAAPPLPASPRQNRRGI